MGKLSYSADRPTLSELGVSPALRETLAAAGYVIVPRAPTPKMVSEAWASAFAEKAEDVWADMIEAWEGEERTIMG